MKNWVWCLLVVAGLSFIASVVTAFPLRDPQVPFRSHRLESWMQDLDPGINVTTDQLNAQVWSAAGGALVIKLVVGGNIMRPDPVIGIYNSSEANPTLYPVFLSGVQERGWQALLLFRRYSVDVEVRDLRSDVQRRTTYYGVNSESFGFYYQIQFSTWFSQDYRNPTPQALSYASKSLPDNYWVCFESSPYDPSHTTPGDPDSFLGETNFDDTILNIEPAIPTPATGTTWGRVKGLYR